MIIYEAIKSEFKEDIFNSVIEERILSNLKQKLNKNVAPNEIRSWTNSLIHMKEVLDDASIPDNVGVAIEYKIPNTSKRVDFIVSGYSDNHKPTALIIELKQWESATKITSKDGIVETFLNQSIRETTHPSYQAWTYATLIKEYNENIRHDDIEIIPSAFLHNYKQEDPEDLLDLQFKKYIDSAPVFFKHDKQKLREFIKKYIHIGDNKEILYRIDHGVIRPSKSLQDVVSKLVEGHEEFKLIDDQKIVFEQALSLASKSFSDNKKRVLIVEGGPGTGKSVLALNLLSKLIKYDQGKLVQYVTKNSAPRNVFSQKLANSGKKKVFIKSTFNGSGSFTDAEVNQFDALIVDEAHRLNAKSGMFQNLGENQIKEIIRAGLFSIFFIDEAQKVTLKDIGSTEEIRKWVSYLNAEVYENKLESQFRCNGSDGYLAWIDSMLQIRETANETFAADFDYDFRIFDDPNEMREAIKAKNHNNKARIVAGYCWDWYKDYKNNPDYYDIEIKEHDFRMSWNLGNHDTWAINPESIEQAGCIHTSQGLEFDYVGVIIGDDIRFENGKFITDFTKRAKTDQSLKGIKSLYKKDPDKALKLADEIIKNTYRTLLTRGQKGCYVYITDSNLKHFFREILNS
ncbi:MAG: DUF2075 domain-containing protein [Erysipelothrix sp.]|nr:DUF2075 domain-containing protein [Erysipelothrix sp.]